MAIGVAVGDTPTGPFVDAIGKPLVDGDWANIDPTVYRRRWVRLGCFGETQILYIKLNEI